MSETGRGEPPPGWDRTELGELCEIIRGVSFPSGVKVDTPKDGYVACLRTANVQRQVEWGDLWFVPSGYVKRESQIVQRDDILISTANSHELVGKVAQVGHVPHHSTLGAFISLMRFPSGLSGRFFFYQLSSSAVQARIRGMASTTTNISNVSTAKLATLVLQVAPYSEQLRIVGEVEQHFTRLDASVAALERARANLKRYRPAVLKAACEGRLVSTEAELARAESRDYEPADRLLERILRERRAKWEADQLAKMRAAGKEPKDDKWKAKYREPPAPDTADLPELPEGWVSGTWDQISEWVTYGFTRPMPHVESGVPIVTAKHVANGNIDFSTTSATTPEAYRSLSEKDRPKVGDILITKDGTIGRAAVVEGETQFCINQSVAVVWLRSCPLERRFLRYVIESPLTQGAIAGKARGVAIQHLSITDFAKLLVPIPPLSEQRRIVTDVESCLSVVDQLESALEHSLRRADRLRQAILKRAFEGKLVPQDPDDEPATVLLERIRAERKAAAREGDGHRKGQPANNTRRRRVDAEDGETG